MSSVKKRQPLTKAQSSNAKLGVSSSAIDNSAFLESIKQDSHLFEGLAGDKPPQTWNKPPQPSTFKSDIKSATHGFSLNVNFRENPQFMQLYDQNSKLKLKESRLQATIKELRQQNKDAHRPGLNKKQAQQLMGLRRENKELNRALFQMRSAQRTQSQKRAVSTIEKEKMADLLKVIEKYKSQAFSAEEQLKRYQQNEHLKPAASNLNQSVRKEKEFQFSNEYSMVRQKSYAYQSPSLNIELNRLKQQNTFLQSEISKLNAQMTTKNLLQDEVYQLKLENQKLEDRIRRMTESPLFGGMNERLQDETKVKALEDKLKMYNQRVEKEKEKVIRLQTELKMTQAKLVDSSLSAQTTEHENVNLRSKVKQHPIIDVILRDEEMLQKVIGYLQTQSYRSDIKGSTDKNNPRYSKKDPNIKIETLISENQLLALELTRNQNMLRTLKSMYEQHQKVRQLEQRQFSQLLEEKDRRINELAVMAGQKNKMEVMKNGVRYEDEVSAFSLDDNIVYEPGINYFDIYLADLNLVDIFVRQQVKISDVSKIMSFASVDFYNHKTQHTKVSTGLKYNMNSQFSFKVAEDQCLFSYLEKGEVTINIWTTDGGKTIILGEAKISLKPMITNSKPNLAPVVNSSVPIYLHNRSIGSLNFVMRMRLPIYKQLSQLKSSVIDTFSATQSLNLASYQTRKLIVKIQGAEGLPMHVTSFVSYTLNNNDYYTEAFAGSHPLYDDMKVIPITYTPQFQQYLRRQDLELTVFDDNAPLNDNQHSDLIGVARVPLSKLLFGGGRIDESLRIVSNKGEIKGNLLVKVSWDQMDDNNSNIKGSIAAGAAQMFQGSFGNSFNPMTESKGTYRNQSIVGGGGQITNMLARAFSKKPSTPEEINNYIRQQAITQGINPNDLYYKFDENGTGVISKGQLKQGLAVGFGIKLDENELENYFDSFEKPITLDSFYKHFGIKGEDDSRQNPRQSKKPLIKMTQSITSSSTPKTPQQINDMLRQYAANKSLSIDDLYRKFDDNKTGIISKDELKQGLFSGFNIKLPQTQLETYFRSFQQPINFANFQKGILSGQSLSTINKFVQKNSSHLKKIPLKQYLKGKDIFEVTLDIDKDNNGVITKKELTKYLQEKGVQTHEVIDERISLMDFLKKHSLKTESQSSIQIPNTGQLYTTKTKYVPASDNLSSFGRKASRR